MFAGASSSAGNFMSLFENWIHAISRLPSANSIMVALDCRGCFSVASTTQKVSMLLVIGVRVKGIRLPVQDGGVPSMRHGSIGIQQPDVHVCAAEKFRVLVRGAAV